MRMDAQESGTSVSLYTKDLTTTRQGHDPCRMRKASGPGQIDEVAGEIQ